MTPFAVLAAATFTIAAGVLVYGIVRERRELRARRARRAAYHRCEADKLRHVNGAHAALNLTGAGADQIYPDDRP